MNAKTMVCWVILALGLYGCGAGVPGSGVSKTEARTLAPFDHITFQGVGSALISVGGPQVLEITADDNLLPLIETRILEGALIIRPKQEIQPKSELVVKIHVPDLQGLTLAGDTTAEVLGVASESFDIAITGHGMATAGGRTESLSATIQGSGAVRATELQASRTRVKIIGSGEVAIHTTDDLDITIMGSGNVRYSGDPKITKTVLGSGSIEKVR